MQKFFGQKFKRQFGAVLILTVASVVSAQQKAVSPTPNKPADVIEDDEVLRVETELVSVPTIVLDKTGKPLTKLTAKNFQVFEDNQPQEIKDFQTTETPFEIALLLDTSGSTRGELSLIQRAATEFIKALRPGDKVAIVAFGSETVDNRREAIVEVLQDLTDDREALALALERAQTSNGTPFYEGIEIVATKVFRAPATAEQRGRRAIVALTDGVDSTSAIEFEDARAAVAELDLAAYFVQVNTEDFVEERVLGNCEDDSAMRLSTAQLRRYRKMLKTRAGAPLPQIESFCDLGQFERLSISRNLYKIARFELAQLAKNSGGKVFPVAELREARQAFAQVAAEIGTQYNLGYYSNNPQRDGAFRKIRVELRNLPAGAQIKAREGYVPAKN